MSIAGLIACGLAPTQARQFCAALDVFLPRFEIDTPLRVAAFIAQCAHESNDFTALEESLYYRDPGRLSVIFYSAFHGRAAEAMPFTKNPQALANRVYAGRNGNGDSDTGDGWRYRGRGLIQLTGRGNYQQAGNACQRDWLAYPDSVAMPVGAVQSAAWYWRAHGCNRLADDSAIDAITAKINGPAMLGADARRQRFEQALEALL